MARPRALGAYIFAGGFTVGVKDHFDVLAHWEGDAYGVSTARKNFPKLPIYHGPDKWPLEDPAYQDLDFIYGNPPCAAWSVAGYTKTRGTDKWRTDPRVACTEKHFSLMEQLRPKAWVWESVTQAFTKGEEFVKGLEARALAAGYSVTYVLHDSKWLGLPQTRKRFFMLCHRVDVKIPTPNFAPPKTAMEGLAEVMPTRLDWTVKIEPLVAKWLKNTYFDMPPGMRVRGYWEDFVPKDQWVTGDRGQIVGRPSFGHKRLPVDRPADAVVGYALIHPTEKRWITINEMAALCGFPPDYTFEATTANAAASLIARGVCPPVGRWLAAIVAQACRHGDPVETPTVTLVDIRKPPGESPQTTSIKEPRPRRADAPPPAPTRPALGEPRPRPGVGRMAFLQFLIMMDRYTGDEMVAIVKKHWPESKVSKADVSTQRGDLKRAAAAAGRPLPPKAIRARG